MEKIVSVVVILFVLAAGGIAYLYHQDQFDKQQLSVQQDSQVQTSNTPNSKVSVQSSSNTSATTTDTKQQLTTCINQANQEEVSELQYENNLLKTQYIASSIVNSYISSVQQETQTQVSECQDEYGS